MAIRLTTKKSTISISGMSCASCSQIIENILKKTVGIIDVNVNLATEKAYVTFDEEKISEKEIIALINSTGYKASLETEKTTIKIGGMTCASCSQTIENTLKNTEGVIEANVNLASEKATVKYDPKKIKYETLTKVIESTSTIDAPLTHPKYLS